MIKICLSVLADASTYTTRRLVASYRAPRLKTNRAVSVRVSGSPAALTREEINLALAHLPSADRTTTPLGETFSLDALQRATSLVV